MRQESVSVFSQGQQSVVFVEECVLSSALVAVPLAVACVRIQLKDSRTVRAAGWP